ncbi:unnamed protein product [Clonostachys rosea]|uniref:Uncharacterized protein n=1 Tax=Bionectria ochroleuca TaxID=29856 RepID=A0ABY6V0I4_BIOOC|nr:unnamed protein product [Clonostachys rosea]
MFALSSSIRWAPRAHLAFTRAISSLPSNPHIKVFDDHTSPASHILTYLDNDPPSKKLSIGTSAIIPPTPQSFRQNPEFLKILDEVIQEYGHEDEDVVSQARALAGPGGFNLGSGGVFFPQQKRRQKKGAAGGDGAGGASSQGGAGGAGRGGWVHLSDRRNPPDYGRIAWPEDILGSVEVDQTGTVIGKVQPSGTYRIVTNEGILGLSPFLREKLVERLKQEYAKAK